VSPDAHDSEPSTTKVCPACGESIRTLAKKCMHCGEWLDSEAREERRARGLGPPATPLTLKIFGILIIGLHGLGCVVLLAALVVVGDRDGNLAPGGFVHALIAAMGIGLFRGKRRAVVCVGIFTCLLLIGVLYVLSETGGRAAAILLVPAFYAVPFAVGVLSWKQLT